MQKKPTAPSTAAAARRDRIVRKLNKQYGPGTFVTFEDASSNVKKRYDTGSPILNVLLSGKVSDGIASGRMYEFYGEEQVGKSTTCALIAAALQRRYDALVCFIDTESTMTHKRALTLGLDGDRLIYGEEEFVEHILPQIGAFVAHVGAQPGVVVWDTVHASRSKQSEGRELGRERRAVVAALMSEGLPRIAKALARSNAILIACNQMRAEIDDNPYRTKRERETTRGGKALKFHSEARLRFAYSGDYYRVVQKKKRLSGFVVDVACTKNKHAANDVSARLLFQTRGAPGAFNDALSCVLTLTRWGAATKSKSTGRIAFKGKRYTLPAWENAYVNDPTFRLQALAALQCAYDEQTETRNEIEEEG